MSDENIIDLASQSLLSAHSYLFWYYHKLSGQVLKTTLTSTLYEGFTNKGYTKA